MLRETRTENGYVRGTVGTDARITVYKGIPFAADTSGENRWRPPQPARDWAGVRDCTDFGPIPVQKTPGEDPDAFYSKEWHVDPEVPMGEDCLRANIWTPARSADEKLPVMVWIFGGGFREGYPQFCGRCTWRTVSERRSDRGRRLLFRGLSGWRRSWDLLLLPRVLRTRDSGSFWERADVI